MRNEILLAQGQKYEDANELNHASNCYHQILDKEPRHVPALKRLGLLAMRRRNYTEAKVLLKWAYHFAPKDIDVSTAWANLHKYPLTSFELNLNDSNEATPKSDSSSQQTEKEDNIPGFEFLTGEKFSNGAIINYTPTYRHSHLKNYLIEELRDKNVIHIGACDHANLIGEKIKNGHYYHKIITDASAQCIGLDINISAINIAKSKFKINNIIYHDVEHDSTPKYISQNQWDYILALDVIEHIDNPILFLKKINKKFFKYAKKILITVPNAFKLENFANCIENKEVINSDHRFWFTPYTISKVAYRAGIVPKKILMIQRSSFPNNESTKYPFFRDTILMECELKNA